MSTQYPLQLPDELMAEIESTSDATHLSKADVMRQSMRLGLPRLREKLTAAEERLTNVDPLPERVLKRLYRQRKEDQASIRRFIDAQPKGFE